jgi:ABC-type glycerol-3-phosphate transport system substrate-binding protein
MMKWIFFSLLALGLAACGGSSAEIALPLADDQPTVLFFYTDN